MILVASVQWDRNGGKVPKQAQHLIVGGIVRHKESKVCVANNRRNSDESSSATRDDADILVGVLRKLPFTMLGIVQIGDCFPKWLDARGWSILATFHGDIDAVWSFEAALDV